VNGDGPKALVLQSFMSLDIPHSFIKEFSAKYPALTMQLFASKDKAFFLPISQPCGQFLSSLFSMPALRSGSRRYIYSSSILTFLLFRTLFGKQTSRPFSIRILRVCILQDPVAAKHSKIKDKTIKDLLGNINFSLINKLLEHVYGSDTSKIPTINYLGPHCHS